MISDQIKTGVDRAPHRSLLYALGLTEEELSRPLIAVVSAQSDIIPGHVHLDKIAEAVKAGVYAAGGTPVVVPAIGVCDGIVMGHKGMHYSLASRELIADSVETLLTAHCFDGAVLIPNCDKIVPRYADGSHPREHPCAGMLRRPPCWRVMSAERRPACPRCSRQWAPIRRASWTMRGP